MPLDPRKSWSSWRLLTVGGCVIGAGLNRSGRGQNRRRRDQTAMVAPGFLANPEVRRWLNGVEPAWTMLEFDSFNALHGEPSANNKAIRLEPKLTATEVSLSAVAVNAMLLLRRAAESGGLKLTATGNLSRAVVEG